MEYNRTYNEGEYEWDEVKSLANLRKHGVAFSEAVTALEDQHAMTSQDLRLVGEDRFVTLGRDARGRLLVVVFAHRPERLRLISARRASASERRRYEEAR